LSIWRLISCEIASLTSKNARGSDRLTRGDDYSPRREAFILLDPCHALGQAFAADLCRRGLRPVAVSEDPGKGCEFATRMAFEGCCIPHRTVHAEFPDAEIHLARDLARVFGGARGMISFFPMPARATRWLDLPVSAANERIRTALNRRLRLLRALAPLLERRGFLQNVVMGVVDDAGRPVGRVGSATAQLWDDLLAGEWERRGVLVRRTYTRMVASDARGTADVVSDLDRVRSDFERCLAQTSMPGVA
jgi:hypothetical protein